MDANPHDSSGDTALFPDLALAGRRAIAFAQRQAQPQRFAVSALDEWPIVSPTSRASTRSAGAHMWVRHTGDCDERGSHEV
jgi:hypothetical protein